MNEETQFSNFRCPVVWLQEIDELVRQGVYKNRTHFIQDAIREKLFPDQVREERKKQILAILQQDPEIRKELNL